MFTVRIQKKGLFSELYLLGGGVDEATANMFTPPGTFHSRSVKMAAPPVASRTVRVLLDGADRLHPRARVRAERDARRRGREAVLLAIVVRAGRAQSVESVECQLSQLSQLRTS